jgi:hypothetical protein
MWRHHRAAWRWTVRRKAGWRASRARRRITRMRRRTALMMFVTMILGGG